MASSMVGLTIKIKILPLRVCSLNLGPDDRIVQRKFENTRYECSVKDCNPVTGSSPVLKMESIQWIQNEAIAHVQ